jgi:hypothetical protein
MTRVRLSPLVDEIQGTLYEVVFKKSPKGNLIVTKRPDMSGVKWSKAQKNQRQRMAQASQYARAARADAEVRAIYEEMAVRENKRPYYVALSDYFKGRDLLATMSKPRRSPRQARGNHGKS